MLGPQPRSRSILVDEKYTADFPKPVRATRSVRFRPDTTAVTASIAPAWLRIGPVRGCTGLAKSVCLGQHSQLNRVYEMEFHPCRSRIDCHHVIGNSLYEQHRYQGPRLCPCHRPGYQHPYSRAAGGRLTKRGSVALAPPGLEKLGAWVSMGLRVINTDPRS